MSSKHTALLWEIRGQDIIGKGANSHICTWVDSIHNAKLIAAAPDLLEALKDLFGLIEDGSLVRDISKDHESGWALTQLSFVKKLKAADSAIKKAES